MRSGGEGGGRTPKSKAGAETARSQENQRGYVAKMPELYKEEKLRGGRRGKLKLSLSEGGIELVGR